MSIDSALVVIAFLIVINMIHTCVQVVSAKKQILEALRPSDGEPEPAGVGEPVQKQERKK